jgi:hypothetical protein
MMTLPEGYEWRRGSTDELWLLYQDQNVARVTTERQPRRPGGRPIITGYIVETGSGRLPFAFNPENSTARKLLASIKNQLPGMLRKYRCMECDAHIPLRFSPGFSKENSSWCEHVCQNERSAPFLDAPQSVNPGDGCEAATSENVAQDYPVGDPPCAAGGMEASALDAPKPELYRVDGNRHGRIWEDESWQGDWTWPVTDAELAALCCLVYRRETGRWPWLWGNMQAAQLQRDEYRELWKVMASKIDPNPHDGDPVSQFVAELLGAAS